MSFIMKNIVLVIVVVLGVLLLVFDGTREFGIIAIFCAVLYLLWDNGEDNNEGIYNLNL